MIISCDKTTLLNGISIASKALPSKSVNPVCEGILFNAKGNEIILTATDNSMTIQTKIAATVHEEGESVINGKFFAEVIRRMPEGTVNISGGFREGIEITGGFAKMNISSLDPDEYPELPVIDRDNFFTVPQNELRTLINQTIFATAADESRPILTGCLFETEGDNMRVVALDGFRLALKNSKIEETDQPVKAIIPARALSEITKIVSDTDALARIYIQRTYCMFEIEETKIMTRLIEGDYINYKPIIPRELTSRITLNRIDMLESIDRAWLIVRENTRNSYIVFKFEDNKLIITSRSDTGNAYEEVNFSGEAAKIEIGFNPKYFVDCLKNIDDEFITFSFTTPASPTVVTPVDGNEYLYLILPVRL